MSDERLLPFARTTWLAWGLRGLRGGCVGVGGAAVAVGVAVYLYVAMSVLRGAANSFSSAAPVPPVKKERKNTDIPS